MNTFVFYEQQYSRKIFKYLCKIIITISIIIMVSYFSWISKYKNKHREMSS